MALKGGSRDCRPVSSAIPPSGRAAVKPGRLNRAYASMRSVVSGYGIARGSCTAAARGQRRANLTGAIFGATNLYELSFQLPTSRARSSATQFWWYKSCGSNLCKLTA